MSLISANIYTSKRLIKRNAAMKSYTPIEDANIAALNVQLAEVDAKIKRQFYIDILMSAVVVTAFIIGAAL